MEGFLRVISYEKDYLDKLNANPNSNPNTVKIQNEKVNKLWLYYNQLHQAIEPLSNKMTEQYEHGKRMGRELERSLQKKQDNPYRGDKEAFRAAHEFNVKQQDKHLF